MEPIKLIIERSDCNFDFWFAFSDFHLKELCVAYGIPLEGPKKTKSGEISNRVGNGIKAGRIVDINRGNFDFYLSKIIK